MPASMIRAPTGGRPKVIGSSIATVAMVPMPGNTPTSVPTRAPIRHIRRLVGVSATPKPRARFVKISITPSLDQETRKHRHWQAEDVGEQDRTPCGQDSADDGRLDPLGFMAARGGDHEAYERGDDEAERADRQREEYDRQHDE